MTRIWESLLKMVWWMRIVPAIISVFFVLLTRCRHECEIHCILKMMIPDFPFCREIMWLWQICLMRILTVLSTIIFHRLMYLFRRQILRCAAKCWTIVLRDRRLKRHGDLLRQGLLWMDRLYCAKAWMMARS